MEAKDREFAQECLDELKRLHTYRDEIPDRIVGSDDLDPFYKIRKAWFTSIHAILNLASTRNFVGVVLRQKIPVLLERIDKEISPGKVHPHAGHIHHANRIVKWTIRSLERLLR